MNTKRLFFGFLTATLTLTPLVTLKSASAVEQFNHQTIQSSYAKADLIARGGGAAAGGDLAIGAAQLGLQINDLVVASKNREGFVKGLMEQATYAARGKYNVMVFNMSQPYDRNINGVKFFKQANYQGVPYGIWIFEDGTFTNKGDGGFINWAFNGKFNRSGNQGHVVTFQKL
ncbi:stress protein [Brasilonema sp. CT11]|nr:stress protein [Brasilonema sp. CT11]